MDGDGVFADSRAQTGQQGKLLAALTGWDKEITPNAIEVYVSRLRGKLEPHGIALRSIRGFGYRLELVGGESLDAPALP
jgi:DNA-binding response OmpR family regulator